MIETKITFELTGFASFAYQFSAAQFRELAIIRWLDPETSSKVAYTPQGTPVVLGSTFGQRYKFKFKLWLSDTELLAWKAMVFEHFRRINGNLSDPFVEVFDEVKPLVEHSFTRPGTASFYDAPTGAVKYYARFKVVLSVTENSVGDPVSKGGTPYWPIEFGATEVDLLDATGSNTEIPSGQPDFLDLGSLGSPTPGVIYASDGGGAQGRPGVEYRVTFAKFKLWVHPAGFFTNAACSTIQEAGYGPYQVGTQYKQIVYGGAFTYNCTPPTGPQGQIYFLQIGDIPYQESLYKGIAHAGTVRVEYLP